MNQDARLSIRAEPELIDRLRTLAEQKHTSFSNLVRQTLWRTVDQQEQATMNDLEKLAKKIGTAEHEGVTYILANEATYSNRVFPGWFGDAQEGEPYTTEFVADAIGPDDGEYQVYWQFDTVKGEEPEDNGNWPWGDEHITQVWAQ